MLSLFLFVGIILLISVNIELLLRAAIGLISPDLELPGDDAPNEMLVAE